LNSQRAAEISADQGFFVLPTLVVAWSSDESIESLLRAVRHRLAPLTEIGALKCLGPLKDPMPAERLAEECQTLLSLDLWHRLVSQGYQPSLPGPNSLASLRVIFIIDRSNVSHNLTLDIIEKSKKLLARRARLMPMLIWLGDKPKSNPPGLASYWPRIRLERMASGGMEVPRRDMLAAVEHLLVALIGSNMIQYLDEIVNKDETKWIIIGASALLLDNRTEQFVRELVLNEILNSLVASLDMDLDRIERAMAERARKLRESLLQEASAILRESGWDVEISGLSIRKCILRNLNLLKSLFGAYYGGIENQRSSLLSWNSMYRWFLDLISALADPFSPDPSIEEKIYQHYRELSEKLERIASKILKEYQDLRILLGAFLDRGLLTRIPAGEHPHRWFGDPPLPSGLRAAIAALFAFQKHLAEEGDVEDAREPARGSVQPAPLSGDAYLRAAGDVDAQIVRESLLRYVHFARQLASPWGVLLYLLPAWPLLTFLIQAFARWELIPAFLVAGLILFLIGVVDLAYHWLWKARRLLHESQSRAHRALADRVLSLTARVIQDYRDWMLSRLQEDELALEDVYIAFLRRHVAAEQTSRDLNEARSQEINLCTYSILYKEELQRWAKEAVEALRQYPDWKREFAPFENALTARIITDVWPLAKQPLPGQALLKELEAVCDRVIRDCARPVWHPATAVEREVKDLQGGKRWEWLWQRAQPMGSSESPGLEFTIIITREEFLMGSTGKNSPYWQPEWRFVSSILDREEICVRGIIEG
jgi:hypothetical protein